MAVAEQESAIDYIAKELEAVGLTALADAVWDLIENQTVPKKQMAAEIRKLPAYTTRFSANAARQKAGFRPLSPAEYIDLEENYRDILQNYGLPQKYYVSSDPLASQPTLDKLIASNVDALTLEKRIIQGVDEIQNKPPQYLQAIQEYYPEIDRADIIAYVVDPKNALQDIKTKVAAAQIGGSAKMFGLGVSKQRAEELSKIVSEEGARSGFQAISEVAPRLSALSGFQKEKPLSQEELEAATFGTQGATEAKSKIAKVVGTEQGFFSGSSGLMQGALARERAGQY